MLLCQESGGEFLSAMTDFENIVIAGRCPTEVTLVFFGGRLLALTQWAFAQLRLASP